MKKKSIKYLRVRITEDLHNELKIKATKEKKSLQKLIEEILDKEKQI